MKIAKLIKPFEAHGKSASLSRAAWQRFRRNPTAMAGLTVIALFALVALLGYAITPDSTPYCNQQYLELATLKPGSKATFLCINSSTNQQINSSTNQHL